MVGSILIVVTFSKSADDYFGNIWEFFGNSLEILWEFFRHSLGIREFFGNSLGIVLELYWNSLGMYIWGVLNVWVLILGNLT